MSTQPSVPANAPTEAVSHPRAAEFRRGWPVLIGAVIGVGVGVSALPFYTLGVFMHELERTMGWSRTELSAGQTAWALGVAIASPFVGKLVDRFGVRGPIAAGLLFLALSFALLGTVIDSLPAFVAMYGIMAILAGASSPLAYTRVVTAWFVHARGLALGITLMGTGLAGMFAPAFVATVAQQHGWQGAYLGLAAIVLVALPSVLWLVRMPPVNHGSTTEVHAAADGISFSNSVRTRVFWQLATIFFVLTAAVSGLVAHLVPMLVDAGLQPGRAAAIAGLIGGSVVFGRIAVGAVIDYVSAPYVAAVTFMLTALGCLALLAYGSVAAPVAAVGIGLALGAEVDLVGFFTARYFGFAAYGRIYGVQYALIVLGAAVSPIWIGSAYQATGNYSAALGGCAVMLLSVVAVCVLLPKLPAQHRARA